VSEGVPDAWAPAILCNSTLVLHENQSKITQREKLLLKRSEFTVTWYAEVAAPKTNSEGKSLRVKPRTGAARSRRKREKTAMAGADIAAATRT
jgi:hypothetical protein